MNVRYTGALVALCAVAGSACWASGLAGLGASVALRPKAGVLIPFSSDYDDVLEESFQGGGSVKLTVGHLGLEGGFEVVRDTGKVKHTATVITEGEEGPVTSFVTREVKTEGSVGAVKITGTFELNPLAGTKGHPAEANAYIGAGFGYYPATIDRGFGDEDFYGYGPHAVIGGEYFFNIVFGVFLEVQYAYVWLKGRGRSKDRDMQGVSLMGGISLKF